jgi:hypothetical protein
MPEEKNEIQGRDPPLVMPEKKMLDWINVLLLWTEEAGSFGTWTRTEVRNGKESDPPMRTRILLSFAPFPKVRDCTQKKHTYTHTQKQLFLLIIRKLLLLRCTYGCRAVGFASLEHAPMHYLSARFLIALTGTVVLECAIDYHMIPEIDLI